ncbi:uncharacterized protein [Coffea arabica]|uniref:Uncharacterized protein isoform X4 n=1 Tax=Coffea arabica TaxID=13443 RepID=A0ABM4VVQ1_COFAR
MMARLLWMYSVSVTSLSDLYRKGLSGASTQLSYFSSKRKKKIQVRCQRKIWLSCRQCSFALGIGGFPKVVAGELSKSCHGWQQKQNYFWTGERCIVRFKLHALYKSFY